MTTGQTGIFPFGAPGRYPANLPVSPYRVPSAPFDNLISQYGVRMLWQKAHLCPCAWGGRVRGSADPNCLQCFGMGWYYDPPVGPFPVLFTYSHSPLASDEPGSVMTPQIGQVLWGEPTIFIGHDVSPQVWYEASEYDRLIEVDALWRFHVALTNQQKTTLPYSDGFLMSPSGAVAVYDTVSHAVSFVTGYSSGAAPQGVAVTLPDGFAPGQGYVVEFFANPVYNIFRRSGGLPHTRPLAGGTIQLPKSFRAKPLDLWERKGNTY